MIGAMRVTAPDGAIAGARWAGTAGPALVFVHGVGSTAAIWDAQLEAFAGTNRCIAVELRGNGALAPDPKPALITRAGFAADVLAVADACEVDRFTLVGCSLGGVVAFELWKRAPQRFDAMSVVGSFARYPDGRAYANGVEAAVRSAGDMRTFATQRAAKLGLPPGRLRETIDQMACKSVSSYAAATDATWTGDYLDVLPGIGVPVQVLCGERDAIAPPRLSHEIASAIPGATFAIVEGAGHVANADAPERFNALLGEFLAGISR
ncbi:MAG TPA: alpha/beta fold hydrolase [Candidatus Tumulicola sp.]|jgi:3-oxoadipate enol-lactonase